MICVVASPLAQEESDEADGETIEAAVGEESAPTGDVLILKTGDRIEGFQIIRATHRHFILEGLYDPETDESLEIKISRTQVEEVIRDDIEPEEQRAQAKKRALARQRTTIQGARLSDTLYGLLEQVIGDPPLNTEGMNLTQVLNEVNKRVGGAIKIAAPVQNPPRGWKGVIEPDTTLAMFLDNIVAPNYPGLAVQFEEDVVRIRLKGSPPPGGRGGRSGPPPALGRGGRGGPPPAIGLGPGARGGTPARPDNEG